MAAASCPAPGTWAGRGLHSTSSSFTLHSYFGVNAVVRGMQAYSDDSVFVVWISVLKASSCMHLDWKTLRSCRACEARSWSR